MSLRRFIGAQSNGVYEQALAEIRSGQKKTHWMWFIFPQEKGLGTSETSKFYAIKDLEEAREYLDHPVLGHRLIECVNAVNRDPRLIFGPVDNMKFRSCLTLFSQASLTGMISDPTAFNETYDLWYGE